MVPYNLIDVVNIANDIRNSSDKEYLKILSDIKDNATIEKDNAWFL